MCVAGNEVLSYNWDCRYGVGTVWTKAALVRILPQQWGSYQNPNYSGFFVFYANHRTPHESKS